MICVRRKRYEQNAYYDNQIHLQNVYAVVD